MLDIPEINVLANMFYIEIMHIHNKKCYAYVE
jgi:hypothetical protein